MAVEIAGERGLSLRPLTRLLDALVALGLLAALAFASQLPLMQTVFDRDTGTATALLASMLVLVAVGVVDDRWGLDAPTKFAGQTLARYRVINSDPAREA